MQEGDVTVPGAIPGGYRLGKSLGEGEGAQVYEATHANLPGTFAVKILSAARSKNPRAVQALRDEALTCAALRHPNIVGVLDVNTLGDGRLFVVMERLEGLTLHTRLAGDAALPMIVAVSMVRDIAAGLAAAHEAGIVHRDLNPSNIFLARMAGHRAGFVKILNFGLSHLHAATALERGNVRIMEDPHYMAPEQALGNAAAIDARTDQFALAALAFRMLTGVDAFRGEDALAVMYQIVHMPPRSLSMRSVCPPDVEAVIARALAKQPTDRWKDILEFASSLQDAVDGKQDEDFSRDMATTNPILSDRQLAKAAATVAAGPAPRPRVQDDHHQDTEPVWAKDDDQDLTGERVFAPRRGALLVVFALTALAGAASVLLLGDRFPDSWRRHDLWHTMGLPYALSPPPPPVIPAANDTPPTSEPEAASLSLDAGQDLGTGNVTSDEDRPNSEPAARAEEPEAQEQAAPETPRMTRSAPRKNQRAARRRDRPERGFVWSDNLQRMVPMIPARP